MLKFYKQYFKFKTVLLILMVCFLFYTNRALSCNELNFIYDKNLISDYEYIDDIKQALENNLVEKDYNMKSKIGIALYDLNNDGIKELFVSYDSNSTQLCGFTGNCKKEIFSISANHKEFKKIFLASRVSFLCIEDLKNNGYRNIQIKDSRFKGAIWYFDGFQYKINNNV